MHKINLENFMFIYMYELENYLKSIREEIKLISFQSDEANTDRPLKEFLKNKIEQNFNEIPLKKNAYLTLITDEGPIKYSYELFKQYKIKKVLLTEELNYELKHELKKNKSSIYTNPDIYLEVSNGETLDYLSIELKSTKRDVIPGSSVQQIKPDEWVIFIKHNNNTIDIVTGQYINSINSNMQFPDRSPRPSVSFNELKKWNKLNRRIEADNILYNNNTFQELDKMNLLYNWQDILAQRWVEIVFNTKIKKKEPWFNNNLRKFILVFIKEYEALNDKERKNYIKTIENLIINSNE